MCVCVSECSGGQVWTVCAGCGVTDASCDVDPKTRRFCTMECPIGCFCTSDRPIWHGGRCITYDECPGSYVLLTAVLNGYPLCSVDVSCVATGANGGSCLVPNRFQTEYRYRGKFVEKSFQLQVGGCRCASSYIIG